MLSFGWNHLPSSGKRLPQSSLASEVRKLYAFDDFSFHLPPPLRSGVYQQKSENMPQLNVRLLPVAHPAHIEILELK